MNVTYYSFLLLFKHRMEIDLCKGLWVTQWT